MSNLMRVTSLHKVPFNCQWFVNTPRYVTARTCSSSDTATSAKDAKPMSKMPGVPNVPLLGSLPFMMMDKDFRSIKNIHLYWETMFRKHGEIFKLKIPSQKQMVFLFNADDIEVMFQSTLKNPEREGFLSVKKVRYEAVNNFFEKKAGLLAENGEEWWRVRSKIQTPIMKPTNVRKYLPKVDQVALEFIEKLITLQDQNHEMPETFMDEIYKWALESIGLVALNTRLGCFDPTLSKDSKQMQLINNVSIIFNSLVKLELGSPIWKIYPTKPYKALRDAHSLCLDIVFEYIQAAEERMKEANSSVTSTNKNLTLLEIFLQTEGLSRKDVMTFMLDMFFAGIDTTSHALVFTLYCLSRNPKVQEKLQKEIDEVLGDGTGPITENQLANLSYTKHCVKESLRIFPIVVATVRKASKDTVVGGYLVPKGNQLVASLNATSKDEKYFPRPLEFIPERWGRDRPLGKIHPFAYVPFSHGTRMCIGRRVAEQEIYVILARLMHRFRVDYKHSDMEIVTNFVSVPSQPPRFQFIERK